MAILLKALMLRAFFFEQLLTIEEDSGRAGMTGFYKESNFRIVLKILKSLNPKNPSSDKKNKRHY
ncbi:MAG: hypothetical protein V4642_09260 [Bacteroidota bacterium]